MTIASLHSPTFATGAASAYAPRSSRRTLLGLALLAALAVHGSPALAQTGAAAYPSKAITIVVPFSAGGGVDAVARMLADKLRASLGQPVVVDNKPGASAMLGAQAVVKAAPDGHTLLLGTAGETAINPHVYKERMAYKPERDLTPISLVVRVPNVLVAQPGLPVKNVEELVAYAKKNPGKLSYGSAGNGSAGHLAFEYLKMTADLFMLHVPYRGTGPMMTDLLSGRLEASAVGAAAMLPFIKSGKVRCIATGSAKRLPQLPDVPTVAEQGFPGFEMTQWYGMLAPANMPAANLDKLSAETMKAVKAPASLERLNADAAEAIGGTPAQFAQFIAAEQERWKKVLLRAKVKPD